MKRRRVRFRSLMPVPAEALFAWHTRPGAFERLTPPWENVRVLERSGGIEDGGRLVLAVRAAGMWRRWVAVHQNYEPGRQFCDVQLQGPFAAWTHCHRMHSDGPGQSILEDEIEYALPLGRLGALLAGRYARRQLARMFRYRHDVTANDLQLHHLARAVLPMRVAVSGATGLVGTALVPFLTTGGHHVARLVRGPAVSDDIRWDPNTGTIDAERLEGLDAVIHLAGENIAGRRWNAEHKARIHASRVQGTSLLCQTLASLRRPPRVLVSASATGFYGDRGDEELTETSSAGRGFLSGVCRDWEAATHAAERAGIRVVHLRFGIILTPRGGALAKMLTPFRLGLGGRLDSGRQWMSWMAIDDAVGAIHHALVHAALRGPVNAVAPSPVTNREFTKTLGSVLGRPAILAVPAFSLRLALGEMADALLLASTRVRPQVLEQSGYPFLYGDLEHALRHMLGQAPRASLLRRSPPRPPEHASHAGRSPLPAHQS